MVHLQGTNMSKRHQELKVEHLTEALEKNKGFILASKRYIKKTYGYDVSFATLKSRIMEWGLDEWLLDIRKELAEDCLNRAFHKGIAEGDNHCIFWVLDRYGHHVDFLDSRDTETESKKGWKELLTYVKATAQPQAN